MGMSTKIKKKIFLPTVAELIVSALFTVAVQRDIPMSKNRDPSMLEAEARIKVTFLFHIPLVVINANH